MVNDIAILGVMLSVIIVKLLSGFIRLLVISTAGRRSCARFSISLCGINNEYLLLFTYKTTSMIYATEMSSRQETVTFTRKHFSTKTERDRFFF